MLQIIIWRSHKYYLFQMGKYSSVSSIIERMKKQMHADRNLTKRVNKLAGKAKKSQKKA